MDRGVNSILKAMIKNNPPYALLYSQGVGGEYISYLLSKHFPFQPNGYRFLGKNRWSTLSVFKFIAERDLHSEWLEGIVNDEYFEHYSIIDGGKPFLLRDHLYPRSFEFFKQYIPNIKIISLQSNTDESRDYFSQLYLKKVDADVDVTDIKNIDEWVIENARFLKNPEPTPVWSSDDLFEEYIRNEKIAYGQYQPEFYRLITTKSNIWKDLNICDLLDKFARKIKLEHIKTHINLPFRKEKELNEWIEKVNIDIDNIDPINEQSFKRFSNIHKEDSSYASNPELNPFETLTIDSGYFIEYNENEIKNVLRSIEEFTKSKIINESLCLDGIKTWILKNYHLMENKPIDYRKFKNFCALPFKQLEISPKGMFAPCCVYGGKIANRKGSVYSFKEHSLNDVWKSDYSNKLRADMMNNIPVKSCDACNILEESGGTSRRIRETLRIDNLASLGVYNNKNGNDQPTELHLSLGDICNQKCIICSPENSSLVLNEWIDNGWNPELIDSINSYKNWQDNEENWKILQQWAKKLEQIHFFGGEPFLIKKTWDFLKYCVDNGYSKNISVAFSTNNSIFKEEYYTEILSKFKDVGIMLSADGIEDTFEYCRYPAKWKVFEENFNKVLHLTNHYDNMHLRIGYTVSVYSIGNLADSLAYYQSKLEHKNFRGVWLNMVGQPFLDIKVLAKDIKKEYTEKLQTTPIDKKIFTENDTDFIIKYMNSENEHLTRLWDQFFSYTCARDQYRSSQDDIYKRFGIHVATEFYNWFGAGSEKTRKQWEKEYHDLQ